jgi:hypothetical protein
MVRATIFAILFSTAVLANDIYVEQAQDTQDQDKAALETKSTEKELLSPLSTEKDQQYCSVVAGCYTVNN